MPLSIADIRCPTGGWTHEAVTRCLDEVAAAAVSRLGRRVIGHSAEGRPIELIELGDGPKPVAAWSHMHGDEQTFTTVMLNLLRRLTTPPLPSVLQTILQRCRLSLVVMLNPDGAARLTRVNAQGIDINRDARAVASPEARALRRLILETKPGLALNLHNQSHRRWMPDQNDRVVLSLLAPPADASGVSTAAMETAERTASCVIRAVEPHCGGRVTRYAADYMPRAFGEWVQSQGFPTLLLEAGGWPGDDDVAVDHVSYEALVAALGSFASGEHESTSTAAYAALPRASDRESFDLLITNARLGGDPPAVVDLGVAGPNNSILPGAAGRGVVAAIGDLSVHPRGATLDAEGGVCGPGLVAVAPEAVREGRLDPAAVRQRLARGATTQLIPVEGPIAELACVAERLRSGPPPDARLGIVWVAPDETLLGDALADALPDGVVAVVARSRAKQSLATIGTRLESPLRIGARADLMVVDSPAAQPQGGAPRCVLLGGTVVAEHGRVVVSGAGGWQPRGGCGWGLA